MLSVLALRQKWQLLRVVICVPFFEACTRILSTLQRCSVIYTNLTRKIGDLVTKRPLKQIRALVLGLLENGTIVRTHICHPSVLPTHSLSVGSNPPSPRRLSRPCDVQSNENHCIQWSSIWTQCDMFFGDCGCCSKRRVSVALEQSPNRPLGVLLVFPTAAAREFSTFPPTLQRRVAGNTLVQMFARRRMVCHQLCAMFTEHRSWSPQRRRWPSRKPEQYLEE